MFSDLGVIDSAAETIEFETGPKKGKLQLHCFLAEQISEPTTQTKKIRLEIKPTLKLRARVRRKVRVRVFFFEVQRTFASKCVVRALQQLTLPSPLLAPLL